MNESLHELTQADRDTLRRTVAERGIGVYQWEDWDRSGDSDRNVSFDDLGSRRKRSDLPVHFAEAAFRNLTLLQELARDAKSDRVLIVTRSWSTEVATAPPDRWDNHFNPAKYWMSSYWHENVTDDPEDFGGWEHLYLAEVDISSPSIVALLILASNYETSLPLIFDRSMNWMLRPCDEGGHVWAASVEQADRMRTAHREWLTPATFPVGVVVEEVELQWGLDFDNVPESNVRALLDLAEEHQLVPDGGHARLVDPREGLPVVLGRRTAQLLRVLITNKSADVVSVGGRATEVVTPERARQELSGDGIENLDWYIDNFLDDIGYLDPAEAVDGLIEERRRNPALNYDGIGKPASEA